MSDRPDAKDSPKAFACAQSAENTPLARGGQFNAECEHGFNGERRRRERRKSLRSVLPAGNKYPPGSSEADAVSGSGAFRPPQAWRDCLSDEHARAPATPAASGTAPISKRDSKNINVWVASPQSNLTKTLLPQWVTAPDINVLDHTIADVALLEAHVSHGQPEVLMLDHALLEQLGPESLQEIQARCPRLRILLLCDQPHSGLFEEVFHHRLHGYLQTSCPPRECAKAVRAVSQGDIWLPRNMLAEAFSRLMHTSGRFEVAIENADGRSKCTDSLTIRERQLVELIKQGLTNKQIARQLGIVEDTVKKHLQSVFGKLGVRRRTLIILHPLTP